MFKLQVARGRAHYTTTMVHFILRPHWAMLSGFCGAGKFGIQGNPACLSLTRVRYSGAVPAARPLVLYSAMHLSAPSRAHSARSIDPVMSLIMTVGKSGAHVQWKIAKIGGNGALSIRSNHQFLFSDGHASRLSSLN